MVTPPTAPTPPPEQERLVDALVQTAFVTMAVLNKVGAENDLSLTQLRVLAILRDRRLRMTALADYLGLEKSTMSGLVDRAVKRGLLERAPSTTDGRAVDVLLSKAGRDLADRLYVDVGRSLSAATSALSPGDQRRLQTLLERMLGPAEHDVAPTPLDRQRFEPVFSDDFTADRLDSDRWISHYLPHWTTAERSAARYTVEPDGLRLLIEADQPAWRPDDGLMRVSNLQTGTFSGPRGSGIGQHRHRDDLRVVSPQPTRHLWTPSSGLLEARLRASADPTCMLAVWLVGFEETGPKDSGEICIAELFGNAIGPKRSQVRLGVKAHSDPRLRTEMVDLMLDIDATEEHVYAAEWNAHRVRFYVDDVLVQTVEQALAYPLQLMVDLFEFPVSERRDDAAYPKSALVRAVNGYRLR